MGWSYKTVHFGLKKEGLLGGAFLDEVELEVSLNEYGRLGWELISLVDVQDGLMAVLKQPLGRVPEQQDEFPEIPQESVAELPELEDEVDSECEVYTEGTFEDGHLQAEEESQDSDDEQAETTSTDARPLDPGAMRIG
ncbi:MAG: DUF4177 domain-containing protein [Desulfobulbaceae bacterium]|uniref:DUF4177 domain-containing protein n=1 Tax=Candidatus Desulfatifera sulfidica TaxID=2841691 RepID=A0A8J6NBV0_9BACT|nr:DUF4177 domain-containing protein [Candidatus Desulfatifera sulfidica]